MQEGWTECKRPPIPRAGPSRIVSNRPVGPGWRVLRLEEPSIARAAEPGQFVQVLCAERESTDPLLRRPFSVYWADPGTGTYDLLYTAVGRGTRWMAALPEEGRGDDRLDAIGPFGNSFSPPAPGTEAVLVGGGVGLAPLYFLARRLLALPRPPAILACIGARTAGQLQGISDFRDLGVECHVATDDGSAGFRGFVTGLVEEILAERGDLTRALKVFGCGPPGMNEALRKLVVGRGVPSEICLESRMACGFGICFGCVAPIRKEVGGPLYNRRICWEGPVFDARLLAGESDRPK
jgi:dihydroorotate dehydrogenase electron transfer subunit